MYTYRAKLVKVIDGDTIKCDIDLGFNMWKKNINVRFAGINAPETRTRDKVEKAKGLAAKAEVQRLMDESHDLILFVHELGKYGRPIADIEILTGDLELLNVNKHLVENGFAELKEY